jgi:hypothetical protein
MKTITLKFGKENINGRETFFSTMDLLKMAILNVPSQSGLGIDEIYKRLRLLDILNKHSEFDIFDNNLDNTHLLMKKDIEIEDSDFNKLKELYNEVKWMVVSKFIVDLYEDLKK